MDRVLALLPRVREAADEAERERRMPVDLVREFAAAGLFHLAVPKEFGGAEAEIHDLLRAVELVATGDGSIGWCLAIGATTGLMAGYMPADGAAEVFGNPTAVTGGVFAPFGRATVADGGYRVTGRWPFASGCEHCTWLSGGVLVDGDEGMRHAFMPADQVEIIDTWTVAGLTGTGSHDIAVTDAFVPASRVVDIGSGPRVSGPLYAFPVFGLLALAVAAVALGVARAALDEFVALASSKRPTYGRRTVAERVVVQADVARAEATLRAARAFFYGALDTPEDRVGLRLAATHAVRAAVEVVDVVYTAAGGTAVYASSPLQRHFRDIHVITQHAVVNSNTWELTGRLLLGLPTDTSLL